MGDAFFYLIMESYPKLKKKTHKACFNDYKLIKIMQSVFFDCNRVKSEINIDTIAVNPKYLSLSGSLPNHSYVEDESIRENIGHILN